MFTAHTIESGPAAARRSMTAAISHNDPAAATILCFSNFTLALASRQTT